MRAARARVRQPQRNARRPGRARAGEGLRGRGRPRSPRRARRTLPRRGDRPADRHPLEGHLRGPRARARRVRDGGERHREHPRQELAVEDLTLAAVIATALFFDFTNGFHDTAHAIATSVPTRALPPRTAVVLAAILNFLGAFVSFAVAATIAKGIVNPDAITLSVILAGLVGAITWNLITWFLGLPSSSSHALIGGVAGSSIAASGLDVINWDGIWDKVVIPGILSPTVGFVAALTLMLVTIWVIRRRSPSRVNRVFRRAQIVSGSFVAFTHGTNDAQKTMGIIALALIVSGHLSPDFDRPPSWVIVSSALAMAIGTYVGGWRIIRTMG